jgi:hypothetical protein
MYHNGGFPPIFEGGKKETIQREFSAENILPLSQIFNISSRPEIKFGRTKPIVFNLIDKEPVFESKNKRMKNKKNK